MPQEQLVVITTSICARTEPDETVHVELANERCHLG